MVKERHEQYTVREKEELRLISETTAKEDDFMFSEKKISITLFLSLGGNNLNSV